MPQVTVDASAQIDGLGTVSADAVVVVVSNRDELLAALVRADAHILILDPGLQATFIALVKILALAASLTIVANKIVDAVHEEVHHAIDNRYQIGVEGSIDLKKWGIGSLKGNAVLIPPEQKKSEDTC